MKRITCAALLSLSFLSIPFFSRADVVVVGDFPAAPYCREYQQYVRAGNRIVRSYGTACQQPDGSWLVANPAYNAPPVIGTTTYYVQPEPVIASNVIIGTPYYLGHDWGYWNHPRYRNRDNRYRNDNHHHGDNHHSDDHRDGNRWRK